MDTGLGGHAAALQRIRSLGIAMDGWGAIHRIAPKAAG